MCRPQLWRVVVLAVCCALLTGCAARRGRAEEQPKLSAQQAREDIALLHQTLQRHHPSLYWYNPPGRADSAFTRLLGLMNDSISQPSFYYLTSAAVATLRCGHTSLRPSRTLEKRWAGYRGPVFPLQFICWQPDTLVVTGNLLRNDSVVRRGDRVVAINGRPSAQWVRQFWPFVSADGFTATSRLLNVGNNFGQYLRHTQGLDSLHTIDYVDSAGQLRRHLLRNHVVAPPDSGRARRRDSIARQLPVPAKPNRRLRRQLRQLQLQFQVDTAHATAIMRIASFSTRGSRGYYRRSFRRLEQEGIGKLIVDLRSNTGGDLSKSNLLLKYLSRRPFRLADSVFAISRRPGPAAHTYPRFWFRLGLLFGTRRAVDGRYHMRHFERKVYQPRQRYHFGGQLMVLQNGYSYSASTVVTHQLKGQPGVLIAGLESGGGDYGNTAIFLPTLVLPNSGLRVSLPLFRMVFSPTGTKGRGVMPDLLWLPQTEAVRGQYDGTMRRALAFMGQQ